LQSRIYLEVGVSEAAHFRRTCRTLDYVISAAGKTEIRTARCTASIWSPQKSRRQRCISLFAFRTLVA